MMRRLTRPLSIVALLPLLMGSLFAAPISVAAQTPNCRSVMEAIAAGEADLTLTANTSSFYDQPLDYSLSNLSANVLDVCFPAGLTMISGDGQYQNLVLTRTIAVTVPANGSSDGSLYADCINLERHAPTSGGSFTPGGLADGPLLRVAQAIDARNDQGTLGAQMAVWAITDNFTLESSAGATGQNASMIESLAPILCLDSKDIDEGQAILVQANAGVSLYTNQAQGLEAFCSARGLPTDLGALGTLLAKIGGVSILVLCCGGLLCLGLLVAFIVVIIRLARRRK